MQGLNAIKKAPAMWIANCLNKFIVNVGRSNVIDQKALYNALEEGYICGAAIDTWEEKPKNKNKEYNEEYFS